MAEANICGYLSHWEIQLIGESSLAELGRGEITGFPMQIQVLFSIIIHLELVAKARNGWDELKNR